MSLLFKASAAAFLFPLLMHFSYAADVQPIAQDLNGQEQSVQLIRNATVKVKYNGVTFLVDPMLAPKGAYPGFTGTLHSEIRNPTIPLTLSIQEILNGVDAVLLTHTHEDHWDKFAQQYIPKEMPIFVQNKADEDLLKSQEFKKVRILENGTNFKGVSLYRTFGQHGSDVIWKYDYLRKALGSSIGFVLKAPGQEPIYIAGDTVWHPEVEAEIQKHKPGTIVLNTGGASLETDVNRISYPWVKADPEIIMNKEDVEKAYKVAPQAKIITVHMDAINHMTVTRKDMKKFVEEKGLGSRVHIPQDGEVIVTGSGKN